MNNFQFIIFLISLSIISLINLALLRVLDFVNVVSKQKIIFSKLSLIMLALAPLIFNLLSLSSLKNLVMTIPTQFPIKESTQILQLIPSESQISWSFYISIIYGVGFCIMLCRILFSYFSAKRQLLSSQQIVIDGCSVFLNENIKTPISFGLPKAKIYFPHIAESKWTSRELQISLVHEKIHVAQNDSLWKFLSLIVQALLFFLPWIYYLHKRFELEMEILCDIKTCNETNANVQEYGNLLLAMACKQPKNFIFNNISDSTLKRRFLAMKEKKRSAKFLVSTLSVGLFLISSTTIGIASGITENNNVFKITSKLIIDGKLVSSPVILSKTNQKALIVLTNTNNAGSQGLRMELIARNAPKFVSNDAIEINYDIQYKDGQEKLHSKPQVVVAPNQENKINLSSDSSHSYELRVTADRINS